MGFLQRNCRFWIELRYCKFGGDCKFNHDVQENGNNTKEIDEVKNKLNDFGIKIKEKESEIALKNAQIKSIEKVLNDRITALEDKFGKLVEKLEEFRNENESLRKTIHILEIKLQVK